MKYLKGRFTSRKFLLALLAAIITFGNKYWDWGLSYEEVFLTISGLLAFIGFEGVADITRENNKTEMYLSDDNVKFLKDLVK